MAAASAHRGGHRSSHKLQYFNDRVFVFVSGNQCLGTVSRVVHSKDNRGYYRIMIRACWLACHSKKILCRELLQTTLPMHGVYWSNCSCLIRAGTATKFSWNGHHPTIIGLSARWRILKAWSLLRSWFCSYVASASCRAFAVNGETYVDGSWPGVRPTNPQIANLAL